MLLHAPIAGAATYPDFEEQRGVQLFTRRGYDWSNRYPWADNQPEAVASSSSTT